MRKTRNKKVSPNPLLEKWLEEWRDEARENGSKISYTLNKVDLYVIIHNPSDLPILEPGTFYHSTQPRM